MSKNVRQFYDQLSDVYHLIYADWKSSVLRQGELFDRLLRSQLGTPPFSILDCSCGIGTQAIGLALRGHQVHATDISPASIQRATREAQDFGAALTFGIADLRTLEHQVPGAFDVVLSCDNALPHLLSQEDLQLAARSLWAKLSFDGLLVLSIRDYDSILAERPVATIPSPFDRPEGRQISFQVWNWAEDGRRYTLDLFILKQQQEVWQTQHYTTEYRALLRAELDEILTGAGFSELHWLMPEESGYYQPVLLARKR